MTVPAEAIPSISPEGIESLNVLVVHIARCAVALELHFNGDGPVPPDTCREIVIALGDPEDGMGTVAITAPAR